jgi:hypothetical protein
VKNHPWLKTFNWTELKEQRMKAPFIPPLNKDNFDVGNSNSEWKD